MITNRIADLTVFIVRAGRIDKRILPEIEHIYESGSLNNMALVLNGSIAQKHSYYGYGYGYGYSYGYGHYGYGDGHSNKKSWWKKLFKGKGLK